MERLLAKAAHHTEMQMPLKQELPCWQEPGDEIRGSKGRPGLRGWGMRENGRSIPQSRALLSALSGIRLSTINVSMDKIKI